MKNTLRTMGLVAAGLLGSAVAQAQPPASSARPGASRPAAAAAAPAPGVLRRTPLRAPAPPAPPPAAGAAPGRVRRRACRVALGAGRIHDPRAHRELGRDPGRRHHHGPRGGQAAEPVLLHPLHLGEPGDDLALRRGRPRHHRARRRSVPDELRAERAVLLPQPAARQGVRQRQRQLRDRAHRHPQHVDHHRARAAAQRHGGRRGLRAHRLPERRQAVEDDPRHLGGLRPSRPRSSATTRAST